MSGSEYLLKSVEKLRHAQYIEIEALHSMPILAQSRFDFYPVSRLLRVPRSHEKRQQGCCWCSEKKNFLKNK
jgi:hypothetical protein